MKVRDQVIYLLEHGYSPMDLVQALEGRASRRSIYRWAKGEAAPKAPNTLRALSELVEAAQKKEKR